MIKGTVSYDRNEVYRRVKGEARRMVLEAGRKTAYALDDPLKQLIAQLLGSSEFYQSALNGDLAGQLGLPSTERQALLSALLADIVDTLLIEFRAYAASNNNKIMMLYITLQNTDYKNLLHQHYASVFTLNTQELKWLEWVLLEGDQVIIDGYDVLLSSGKGRSGLGVMIEGGQFRIDPRFSGTRNDNWMTRELNRPSSIVLINDLVIRTFEKFL